ncbi:MAG: J domain-containing protein [Cyanobacteria bacterium J06641_5]
MKPDTTKSDEGKWAALHDVKYDVRSLFIKIHCFLPTDGELKAILKANNCPSDLRRRQAWQVLHALLQAQLQTIRGARAASQKRWDERAKPWAQWLTDFQQALQTQATARGRRWQELHQPHSQSPARQSERSLQLPSHLWQVLELDASTATTTEIKRAYRRLAREHHPDRGGCVDRFLEIHQAYQLLMAARLSV